MSQLWSIVSAYVFKCIANYLNEFGLIKHTLIDYVRYRTGLDPQRFNQAGKVGTQVLSELGKVSKTSGLKMVKTLANGHKNSRGRQEETPDTLAQKGGETQSKYTQKGEEIKHR